VYLKRLELLGFKSFASKTILELDRGVTALVGPNGSGKSNVVDAVRWALGEQSLRAVRSRKSEEVIFAGNGKRPPTGMAEVSLIIDNSEGQFPLPFAEIAVTRRQYRSGEGEYLINRSKARLKDVVELLSHASLGPDSYAVVGQGAVDEVLLQRPDERRALLEAAADISRHQAKLRESLDKLSETGANIRRVDDIRAEISPRLAKLRSQANRARRFEEYNVKLKHMVLWRYLLQIRQTRDRFLSGAETERQHSEAVTHAGGEVEESRRRGGELRRRLRDLELNLEAARERLNGFRLARARAEREAALLQERGASLRLQLSQAEEELAGGRKERQELQAELDRLESERTGWTEREGRIREQVVPLETERRQVQAEERMLRAQLERAAAEQRSATARRSELVERRNSLTRDAGRLAGSQGESLEAARQATERLERLDSDLSAAQEALQLRRTELAELEKRHQQYQEKLRSVLTELEAARRQERDAWQRDNDLKSRVSMLQSLKEQHRGISEGAKLILNARIPGIRGNLASMIRVPAEYVTPVSAALGGAQGYIVSEGLREGLEALGLLVQRSGKATIAPMKLEKREPPQKLVAELKARLEGLLDGIGFRGVASDLVSSAPEGNDLCARYLGLSLVVEEMRDALELYHRLTSLSDGRIPFQIVTMDGRLVRARGDLAAAAGGDKDVSLVARDTELASLSEQAGRAALRLKEAREAVSSLESVQSGLSAEATRANAEVSSLRAQIEKQNAAYAELASQVAKVEAAIEWNRTRAASLEQEVAQNRDAMARTEKDLSTADSRQQQAGAAIEQLQGDLSALQSSISEVAGRLSRLQSEQSAAQNRVRELSARASALSDGCRRADDRINRQQERVSQLREALSRLTDASQPFTPQVSAEELEDAEKVVVDLSARASQLRQQCEAADSEAASLSQIHEQAREDLAAARARLQRTFAELAMLLREALRDAGTEPEEAEPETAEELISLSERVDSELGTVLEGAPLDRMPQTLPEVSSRVESLRKELQAIGTINAEAPEEYRQLSERFSFLADQLDDLSRAESTLRKAIDDLQELMTSRFRETFDLVNAEFGRCFATLFGGGSARLVLTKPDEPLEGGVDVVANLPGKKTTSLLGFSGGERSLTAVALLFAMMRVNPSPFCLLDEVDAALDESNVRRFCEMVKLLSTDTQFLVITHNRTTMETAAALYGVSMQSDSVSKVMSLRLNGHSKE
jgi:chromosome segregation protein